MTDDATRANADTDQEETPTDVVVTLRIRPELNEKAAAAAKAVGIKRAEVMRLALDRGIDRLLEQLEVNLVEP